MPMLGRMTAPPDPPEAPKGFLREFFSGFFDDFTCGDWLEFAIYCAIAIAAVATGVAWLLGKF